MSAVVVAGDTSGTVTLSAPAVAGSNTISLPASTGNALVDIARSLSTDGYVKMSNGLTLQWGISGSITGNTAFTITFPTAFSTACAFATNIPTIANSVGQMAPIVTAVSTTTATFFNSTGISNTFRWFAIGY